MGSVALGAGAVSLWLPQPNSAPVLAAAQASEAESANAAILLRCEWERGLRMAGRSVAAGVRRALKSA